MEFKKVEDIKGYVQKLIDDGTQIIVGEKTARIFARPGIPKEERIISWSVDTDDNSMMEKEALVLVNESGIPDWVEPKLMAWVTQLLMLMDIQING